MSAIKSPVHVPEHRKTLRTRIRDLVYLNFGPDNGGIVLDLSEGGLGFQTVAPFDASERVPFRLLLNGTQEFEASGKLVWSDPSKRYGGIEADLPAAVLEQLLPGYQRPVASALQPVVVPAPEVAAVPASHPAPSPATTNPNEIAPSAPLVLQKTPYPEPPMSRKPAPLTIAPKQKQRKLPIATVSDTLSAGARHHTEDQRPPSPVLDKTTQGYVFMMRTAVQDVADNELHLQAVPARPDPEAWKKLIGEKRLPARLAVLPERHLSPAAMATSTLLQIVLATVVVVVPLLFPQKLAKVIYAVTPVAQLRTEVLLPPKRQPVIPAARVAPEPPRPPDVAPPPPQRQARLIAPKVIEPPKPKPVEVKREDLPQLNQTLNAAPIEIARAAEPARPREPVKTGLLTSGSAAVATVNAPLSKVQTGGFGDAQGLPGESNPNKRANIARAGDPALPPGPGYGNGTGGADGIRGAVASSGFGNGIAIPQPGGSGTPRGEVKQGGFAAATVDTGAASTPKPAEAAAAVQPVVILDKPNPSYSAEARKLGLEGEVLVEVVFPASGPVRVVRVVKGLGHGLDENALRAAQQIKFKPAMRNSQPVDFPATVHIVFQIAY